MKKRRKWQIIGGDSASFETDNNISKIATKVLISRGYDSNLKIKDFIASKYADLNSPFMLKDMQKAVDIIKKSISEKEKIIVYGDYDVDGVTSTAILTDFLKSIGADVEFYIPNRATEGYGLNMVAIDAIKEKNAKLIITVDCGITAIEEVDYLNALGIKTIITDHHSCKDKIPNACAVINPMQQDCTYPFKKLAGVGVAFKLACAIDGDFEKIYEKYADIVAIGTIADVMPIVFENRTIVNKGIIKLNKTENVGLYHLMQEIGVTDVTSGNISFKIAPRINAAGRMGIASDAVTLILTKDEEIAKNRVLELCEKNTKRQEEELEILNSVLQKIDEQIDFTKDKIIIIWGENWHHGVVGIVSSRVIEKYNLPVIILSIEDEMAKGSGRSIDGFNIFEALVTQDKLLTKYGGHELAAGMTLPKENLELFRENMVKIANDNINEEMLIPKLKIDCVLEFDEITLKEVSALDILEPYGIGNSQPVFCTFDVKIENITSLSNDKHLKIVLKQADVMHTAMLFSTSRSEFYFDVGDMVCVAYILNVNEFRNVKTTQLILRDIAPCKKDSLFESECLEKYKKFLLNEKVEKQDISLLKPTRQDFITVWRSIQNSKRSFIVDDYARKIGINPAKFLICLDIFCECGLMSYVAHQGILNVEINNVDFKASLEDTSIYKKFLI